MPKTASVLGVKTLPSPVALHASCASSHHPVVALASPSTSSESKVSLYRVGTGSDLVWEWANVGEPVASKAPTGLGALKAKAKHQPAAPVGKIDQLAWSPQGNYLAVAISPATPTSHSTLAIVSLHDGRSVLSAQQRSGGGRPTCSLPTTASVSSLEWHRLDYAVDPSVSSWSIELVRSLPGLPKIVKESPQGGGGGAGGATSVGGGGAPAGGPVLGNFGAHSGGGAGATGGGGGGGGVFGAKQAMLERERAKEAQRALNLTDAAANGFPSLVSDVRPDQVATTGDDKVKAMLRMSKTAEHDETEKTLLCVGDEHGKVHLYLGGTVFIGTIDVGGGIEEHRDSIVGFQVLSSATSSPFTSTSNANLAVHVASSTSLSVRHLALPVPASLRLVVRQSSALRATIQHAFEALQEVRNLWDEARRIGKGWLQRVADVSRPQGVVLPPTTQMHLLLMTGRPTRSLHDFLASKMNERGLVKWEQEMGLALEKLKRVGWMSVIPAMERTILLLLEVDAWARWPDKFSTYGFNRREVLKAIEVSKEVIKAMTRLQGVVEEEERCFKAFSVWLHYELDKLAQQEGSEVRPNAAFHPVPVSAYIEDSLSPQTSPINPYLSMGLASIALSQNSAIASGQKWVDQIKLAKSPDGDSARVLDATLKRLVEELSGQKEREQLVGHAVQSFRDEVVNVDEFAIDPPFAHAPAPASADEVRPRSSSKTRGASEVPVPTSIPVLLHFVGKLVGDVMDSAMKRVGGAVTLSDRSVSLGPLDEIVEHGKKARRVRSTVSSDGRLHEAWIGNASVYVARHADDIEAVEMAGYKLATSDGSPIKVFGIEFLGSREVVFALETTGMSGTKQFVTTLALNSVTFSRDPLPNDLPLIPLDGSIALDSHFPPSHVTTTSIGDRQIACTLAGEGRRLEFHELDSTTRDDEMELA